MKIVTEEILIEAPSKRGSLNEFVWVSALLIRPTKYEVMTRLDGRYEGPIKTREITPSTLKHAAFHLFHDTVAIAIQVIRSPRVPCWWDESIFTYS